MRTSFPLQGHRPGTEAQSQLIESSGACHTHVSGRDAAGRARLALGGRLAHSGGSFPARHPQPPRCTLCLRNLHPPQAPKARPGPSSPSPSRAQRPLLCWDRFGSLRWGGVGSPGLGWNPVLVPMSPYRAAAQPSPCLSAVTGTLSDTGREQR